MGELTEEERRKIFPQIHFRAMKYKTWQSLIYGRNATLQSLCKIGSWLLVAVFLLYSTRPALGIVMHPNEGEPNLATWTNRPDPNVVGRWGGNASCVAVSSNCVITTRHQGGGVDTFVQLGNNTYVVTEVWNCTGVDLRVAKLYGANLANVVGLYEDTNEAGKDTVIGGYGDGRGAELVNKNRVYGYAWDNSTNTTQRWGQNRIDANDTATGGGYTSQVIIADFDGLGEGNSISYEGIIADHDSGGGWFIYDTNQWEVAGLSRSVEHLDESWFRNSTFPKIPDPDGMDAVRISSYASWISQTIPERLPADLTGDDWVDFLDFSMFASQWSRNDCSNQNNWCEGADFEPPDGSVDWDDLLFLADRWLCDQQCN